ncbi:hypothetical protein [Pandoraea sp.]|uniref:hypothetical protein n=1 Tax=Pandoraea sp. TaxID=1883445 RepID=UPI0012181A6F|nr:hypothetical protein [Pandoraea sp.]TAL52988.1 MAG: hypothetical protein EPN80_17140 [Pandoraea sp.]TAM19412.1 MAG: hypothetical protein EPN65_03455 [Pandoraea sp.]
MIEISETVGTRDFSAQLERTGIVIFKEHGRERSRLTLNDALAALAEERDDDEDIRGATVEDMLRALIHDCARAV